MVSKKLNQHITNSYRRWTDYAKYHASLAGIPDQAGDILNTVMEAILSKDQHIIEVLLSKKKGRYTELDFFVLKMIKLNAHSQTSPYRHNTRSVPTDYNIDPLSLEREDVIQLDCDHKDGIFQKFHTARKILDNLDIPDREKEIFSWKFFADNPLRSWPGDESYSSVCSIYNKVKLLMAGKIRNPNTGRKRWTPAEIAYLKAEYPHIATFRIAQCLGRNYKAVTRKAESLRLQKTKFARMKINRRCSPMTPKRL